MIDTVEMGWSVDEIGDSELRAFEAAVPAPRKLMYWQGDEGRAEVRSIGGYLPGVGPVVQNVDGYLKVCGRSMVKVRQELLFGRDPEKTDNDEVLSSDEANETFQAWTTEIESRLPYLTTDKLKVSRFDVTYQRKVARPMATILALKSAVKATRCGSAWFDNKQGVPTGIMLKGKAVSHRAYIKGLESGNKDMMDVLRSEEQLRKDAKAFGQIIDLRKRLFDRDACMNTLNERYLDVAYEEELDVTDLIKEGKYAQALLILHPELKEAYKDNVKRSSFYEMMKKVREHRATAIPDDLRVPEGAWLKKAG